MSSAPTRVWVIRVCLGELVLLVLLMRGGGGSPGLAGGQRYLRGKIESKLNGIKIRYISTLFRGHQRRESFSSKRWCTTDTRQNMGARASASRPGVRMSIYYAIPSTCGLMTRSRHRYDHTILPHVHVVDTSRRYSRRRQLTLQSSRAFLSSHHSTCRCSSHNPIQSNPIHNRISAEYGTVRYGTLPNAYFRSRLLSLLC